MRLKICALAMLALGGPGLAQASGSYGAGFRLLGNRLPPLLTGTPMDDPSVPAPGTWAYNTVRTSWVSTFDLLPGGTDDAPNWGNPQSGPSKHSADNIPTSFGEIHSLTYSGFAETYGSANVYGNSIGAGIILQGDAGRGVAEATWTRGFSLNAHSSFTFAGLASVGITDPLSAPLNAATSFALNADRSFASLTLGDAADRVRTSIGASIFGLSGVGASFFSYATDASGLLSLTISNPFDTAITGSLQAGTYVNMTSLGHPPVASPVPEPAACLTMALGVGMVGAMARRRQQQQQQRRPTTSPPALQAG